MLFRNCGIFIRSLSDSSRYGVNLIQLCWTDDFPRYYPLIKSLGFHRYESLYSRLRLTNRGSEPRRRYGRSGATTLLSPG